MFEGAGREEPQVRFHEEKGMQSVGGGEYVGKVTDNEWKRLDRGLRRRMGEESGEM